MKPNPTIATLKTTAVLMALLTVAMYLTPDANAQSEPRQRQLRTYIPPDQLVSFLPSTPFDRFVEFVDPIFERVTGKRVVDPESRTTAIGVSIAGMHFLDAFELVLQYSGLVYRETDRFFIVEFAPEEDLILGADAAAGRVDGQGEVKLPATAGTREIQINAILFEYNQSMARDIGLKWSVWLGGDGGGGGEGGSSGGGDSGGEGGGSKDFFLKTDDLFDSLEDIIEAPAKLAFTDLHDFFRTLEDEGIGETVASPQITVQSGQQGRIQIGSDVPIQVRDFAGNTVTQFFSTGIIVEVVPTLIKQRVADSTDAPIVEFVHLNVQIEKSGSRPSSAGIIIDRNTADTQVLLLDGEQTVVGGLYSTEESISRKGVPILKDLPWWFLGLRYIFGNEQRSVNQKELVIVLQAEVLDNLESRIRAAPSSEMLERARQARERAFRRFDTEVSEKIQKTARYRQEGGSK